MKRQGEEREREKNFEILILEFSRQEKRKCEAAIPLLRRENHGQTSLSSYKNRSYKKPVLVRSIFGHDLLTIWNQPHLSNPTKGWGAKCIPITYHRLICGYWRFSISRWKNTLRLKSRHIIALSLKETKKREATLELRIVNSNE